MIYDVCLNKETEELTWKQLCCWELLFPSSPRSFNIYVWLCLNYTDLKISLDFLIWRKLVLKIQSHFTVGTVVWQFHLLIPLQEWHSVIDWSFCAYPLLISFIFYSSLQLLDYYLVMPYNFRSYLILEKIHGLHGMKKTFMWKKKSCIKDFGLKCF